MLAARDCCLRCRLENERKIFFFLFFFVKYKKHLSGKTWAGRIGVERGGRKNEGHQGDDWVFIGRLAGLTCRFTRFFCLRLRF